MYSYQHDRPYAATTPGVAVDDILPAFLHPATAIALAVLFSLLRKAGVISSLLTKM